MQPGIRLPSFQTVTRLKRMIVVIPLKAGLSANWTNLARNTCRVPEPSDLSFVLFMVRGFISATWATQMEIGWSKSFFTRA